MEQYISKRTVAQSPIHTHFALNNSFFGFMNIRVKHVQITFHDVWLRNRSGVRCVLVWIVLNNQHNLFVLNTMRFRKQWSIQKRSDENIDIHFYRSSYRCNVSLDLRNSNRQHRYTQTHRQMMGEWMGRNMKKSITFSCFLRSERKKCEVTSFYGTLCYTAMLLLIVT